MEDIIKMIDAKIRKGSNDYTDTLTLVKLILKSYNPEEYVEGKEDMEAKVKEALDELYK